MKTSEVLALHEALNSGPCVYSSGLAAQIMALPSAYQNAIRFVSSDDFLILSAERDELDQAWLNAEAKITDLSTERDALAADLAAAKTIIEDQEAQRRMREIHHSVERDALAAENARLREALNAAKDWLQRSATHARFCRGDDRCDCGLSRTRLLLGPNALTKESDQ